MWELPPFNKASYEITPDDISLRGPGCLVACKWGAFAGVLAGASVAGSYTAYTTHRAGLTTPEILRLVGRHSFRSGWVCGLAGVVVANMMC